MNSRLFITLVSLLSISLSSQAQNRTFSFGRNGGSISFGGGGSGAIAVSGSRGFNGVSISNGQVRHFRGNGSGVVIGVPAPAQTPFTVPSRNVSPPLSSNNPSQSCPTVVLTEESVSVNVPGVSVQLGSEVERRLNEVKTAMKSRQLDAAQARIVPLAETYPDNPAVQQAASIVAFARADFSSAAASAYQSVGFGGAWQWKDVKPFYENDQRYLDDLEVAQQTAVANPNQADVRFILSNHYVLLGAIKQARSSIQQSLVLMPDDQVVKFLEESLPPATPLVENRQ